MNIGSSELTLPPPAVIHDIPKISRLGSAGSRERPESINGISKLRRSAARVSVDDFISDDLILQVGVAPMRIDVITSTAAHNLAPLLERALARGKYQ